MKTTLLRLPLLMAMFVSACASTNADASGGARARQTTLDASDKDPRAFSSGPYRVEVESADAVTLPTFFDAGRAYVLGTLGQRYRLRISNPTSARVEAVVSIDGLDAIDGEPADFISKHGYVIAPHDDLVVEGFRTSLEQVATFRFSSVPDSYASRKGKDRNVGVIGVAFFRERPPIAYASPPGLDRSWAPGALPRGGAPSPAPRATVEDRAEGAAPSAGRSATESVAPPGKSAARRSGLGTEFGEARPSHVDYTRFQRASASEPSALFELRYNDRQGLLALGIDVDHTRERDDLSLRESADPFPARTFAAPPPR